MPVGACGSQATIYTLLLVLVWLGKGPHPPSSRPLRLRPQAGRGLALLPDLFGAHPSGPKAAKPRWQLWFQAPLGWKTTLRSQGQRGPVWAAGEGQGRGSGALSNAETG